MQYYFVETLLGKLRLACPDETPPGFVEMLSPLVKQAAELTGVKMRELMLYGHYEEQPNDHLYP